MKTIFIKSFVPIICFTLVFSFISSNLVSASESQGIHTYNSTQEVFVNTQFDENSVVKGDGISEGFSVSLIDSSINNEAEIQPYALPILPIAIGTLTRFLVKNTLKKAGETFGKRVVISLLGNGIKNYSDVWKSFKAYRGVTKTNGLSGSKKRYYEWDNTHHDIEVYDKNGKHLGSMDPFDGEMYKPPVPGRNIDI
ncbi:colicin E3/pyocin S6 family cytotoxin [Lysinibacillus sp. 54212]|uniref:colicin E3/pyocin S6 family cytotoxin n=1 Tax=Lysinibacillus sp. 54212 TaxID=3119829 RepID=UPI002FC8810D